MPPPKPTRLPPKGKQLLSALLLASLSACSVISPSARLEEQHQEILPGKTTKQELRSRLGDPSETIQEERANVWVYSGKLEVPFLIGMIPIVGDVLEAVEAAHNLRTHYELIVQFDSRDVVKKYKLREMD